MDETGKSFDDYKVRALPMTYVINKDGYLEGFVSGAITAEQLRKAVNETLKKKVEEDFLNLAKENGINKNRLNYQFTDNCN